VSLQMTRAEREAFLADLHVGVLSLPEPGRGPLTVPIWYAYDPGGELRIVTGRDSRKGRLLAGAERVSLCAQTEAPPWRIDRVIENDEQTAFVYTVLALTAIVAIWLYRGL